VYKGSVAFSLFLKIKIILENCIGYTTKGQLGQPDQNIMYSSFSHIYHGEELP
jgi:hypothetical protein